MPYIYAIEERVYKDRIPPVDGVYKSNTHQFSPDSSNYVPVSKEVAETHTDGRWKLVSVHGNSATGWNPFSVRGAAEVESASGKGKPLPDATGVMLAHDDLVMTTIDKYADLRLCQVLSFTPQKVRVRDLRSGYKTTLKETTDIVKVDKSLYL